MTRSAVFSLWALLVVAAVTPAITDCATINLPAAPTTQAVSRGSGRHVQLARVPLLRRHPLFEAALHEARRWHVRARSAVRYPGLAEAEVGLEVDREPERLRQMAADRYGYLHRALDAAHRAETLARTPDEQYRVAELLSRLEWEAGHPERELRYARLIVRLRPQSDAARTVLRRAARHNARRRAALSSTAVSLSHAVEASYPPAHVDPR